MTQLSLLLIEDDKVDAEVIKIEVGRSEILEIFKHGIRIKVAHTLKDALDSASVEHFDLIMLDLMLPDVLDLEGLQHLVELHPEIPVIIHSGVRDPVLAGRAYALGAQDYIIKGSVDTLELGWRMHAAILRHARWRKFDKVLAN